MFITVQRNQNKNNKKELCRDVSKPLYLIRILIFK